VTARVTSDPSEVRAFVGDLAPLGFDDVAGWGGGAASVIATEASLVHDDYRDSGVRISSRGGPAYAVVRPVDAVSDPNLLGGTGRSPEGEVRVDWLAPITLDFVLPKTTTLATTDLVGAWNDPTGSRIRLEVFDAEGTLLESAEADQGAFLAIRAPGIARARFSHVQTQSVRGFTVDDLYFARPTARNESDAFTYVSLLVGAGPLLALAAIAALVAWRRRRRRARAA